MSSIKFDEFKSEKYQLNELSISNKYGQDDDTDGSDGSSSCDDIGNQESKRIQVEKFYSLDLKDLLASFQRRRNLGSQ